MSMRNLLIFHPICSWLRSVIFLSFALGMEREHRKLRGGLAFAKITIRNWKVFVFYLDLFSFAAKITAGVGCLSDS